MTTQRGRRQECKRRPHRPSAVGQRRRVCRQGRSHLSQLSPEAFLLGLEQSELMLVVRLQRRQLLLLFSFERSQFLLVRRLERLQLIEQQRDQLGLVHAQHLPRGSVGHQLRVDFFATSSAIRPYCRAPAPRHWCSGS